jgi:hypothetical protein
MSATAVEPAYSGWSALDDKGVAEWSRKASYGEGAEERRQTPIEMKIGSVQRGSRGRPPPCTSGTENTILDWRARMERGILYPPTCFLSQSLKTLQGLKGKEMNQHPFFFKLIVFVLSWVIQNIRCFLILLRCSNEWVAIAICKWRFSVMSFKGVIRCIVINYNIFFMWIYM